MDKVLYTTQEQLRSFDLLWFERDVVRGLGFSLEDLLGSTSTIVSGFAATPDGPADLSINLAAGRLYQLANVDTAAFGTIGTDTTQVIQQGIALASQKVTFSTAALTTGQSQWQLVQAQFSQSDAIRTGDPNSGILPFWNVAAPSVPFVGPGNGGGTVNTVRLGQVVIQVITGSPATTGSEVPPNPTTGWVPLYMVDLAFGQTQITAGQIKTAGPSVGTGVPSNYPAAPFLVGLLGPSPTGTTSHHGGVPGQAPKVSLASEVQGVLGISGLPVILGEQGQLQVVSTTQIKFVPWKGGLVAINGTVQQIPSAGVSAGTTGVYVSGVAAQNLAAGTDYLAFLFNNAGTPTIDFWPLATGHLADTTAGNVGIEVRNNSGVPDSTRTFLGLVGTDASTHFQDTDAALLLVSWFNPKDKTSRTTFSANRSGTGTLAEINNEIRASFLTLATRNVPFSVSGSAANSNATQGVVTGVGFDSTSVAEPEQSNAVSPAAGVTSGAINVGLTGRKRALSEGRHFATLLGLAGTGGGTPTWFGGGTSGSVQLDVTVVG